jgi:chromosome segregation ATPase
MASVSSKLRKTIEEAAVGLAALSEVADLVDQRDDLVQKIHVLETDLTTRQRAHQEALARLKAESDRDHAATERTKVTSTEQLADLHRQKVTVEGWLADTRAAIASERQQHQAALEQDLAAHQEALGRLQKATQAAERELASYQERLKALERDLAGSLGRASG